MFNRHTAGIRFLQRLQQLRPASRLARQREGTGRPVARTGYELAAAFYVDARVYISVLLLGDLSTLSAESFGIRPTQFCVRVSCGIFYVGNCFRPLKWVQSNQCLGPVV